MFGVPYFELLLLHLTPRMSYEDRVEKLRPVSPVCISSHSLCYFIYPTLLIFIYVFVCHGSVFFSMEMLTGYAMRKQGNNPCLR
jgi:hypothetical protein